MTIFNEVVAVVNLAIAVMSLLSAVVSWYRGGVIQKLVRLPERIERIEKKIDGINNWKEDAESVIIAISIAEDDVDAKKAKQRLDRDTKYDDLLNDDGDGKTDGGPKSITDQKVKEDD